MATEIDQFIRAACGLRGINPDIGVRVANTEGGVTEPARLGDFSGPPWFSGKSWWPFQLHYGGRGTPYEAWGHTAGQGNGFTELTGWQPGDPKAWRDSVRYALNRARRDGWGAWFGAAAVGITGHMGIDRSVPFDPNAEKWDYETGVDVPLPKVVFNPSEPPHRQEEDWDCSQETAEWMLWSVGRRPSEDWLEGTMLAEGIVTRELGLMDATGAGLAAFLTRHYGEFDYTATNDGLVTFDDIAAEAGRYPIGIGGRTWNHWSGCYGFDAARDVLLLANPSPGFKGVHHELTRQQCRDLGTFSMVRLLHPDLGQVIPNPTPVPPPIPVPPPPDAKDAEIARLNALIAEERTVRGYLTTDVAAALQAAVDELKRHKAA